MKASLWLIVLGLGVAVPTASGMSELETLRERCARQERQIHRLEAENDKLRGGKSESSSASGRSTKTAGTATKADSAKTDPPKATPVKAAPAKTGTGKTTTSGGASGYTVRSGDSLDKIARKNGTTAEKLADANSLELTSILHIGQKLVFPGKSGSHSKSSAKPAARPPVDDPSAAVAKHPADDVTPPAPKPWKSPSDTKSPATAATRQTPPEADPPAEKPPATKTVDTRKTHTVKIEGEMTYGEFATKHGTDTKRLNDLNGLALSRSAVLAKGSELYVPGKP